MENKKKLNKRHLRVPVEVRIDLFDNINKNYLISKNLALGGVCFEYSNELKIGSRKKILLHLTIKNFLNIVEVWIDVVWNKKNSDSYTIGAAFLNLTVSKFNKIKFYLIESIKIQKIGRF